jgi:hypothetical protein
VHFEAPDGKNNLIVAGQRRFARLPIEGTGSRAFLAEAPDETIRVLNLAHGGICVELSRPLEVEGIYQFWLDLGAPFHDIVFATAEVRWVAKTGRMFRCGARIVETNRKWLGPTKPLPVARPTEVKTPQPRYQETNSVVRELPRAPLRMRTG